MRTCPRSSVSSQQRGERSSFDRAASGLTDPERRWSARAVDGCAALDRACRRWNGASCPAGRRGHRTPRAVRWRQLQRLDPSRASHVASECATPVDKKLHFRCSCHVPARQFVGTVPEPWPARPRLAAHCRGGRVRVGSARRRRLRRRPICGDRRYSGIRSTILPSCSPRSRRSCAARASASGKTVSTTGRARPLRTSS
jgi:hypothetical protein